MALYSKQAAFPIRMVYCNSNAKYLYGILISSHRVNPSKHALPGYIPNRCNITTSWPVHSYLTVHGL